MVKQYYLGKLYFFLLQFPIFPFLEEGLVKYFGIEGLFFIIQGDQKLIVLTPYHKSSSYN